MTRDPRTILPDDDANRRLLAHVHPADWQPPAVAERYQLVVVGGGPAGLVAAFGAVGLGARVAIIERGLLGGDCLNVGCVPSKALIASAHAAHAARTAGVHGVRTGPVEVDFPAVMARMRELRAGMSHHDSAARLRDAGIDVFLGSAEFTGPDAVKVGEHTLRFARAVIATGASAARPPIPGIDEVMPLDNHTLFELTEMPQRLAVLGAGAIGAEMAQSFARFGAEVTLIDMAPRVLAREDPEASALVEKQMEADGVRLLMGTAIERFERDGEDKVVIAGEHRIVADEILMALGRRPNTEGLGLEAAGVAFDRKGVVVNDHMRTSNPNIYAAGDVASRFQFTHAADFMARTVLRNALFFPSAKASDLIIPWCTYTSPAVAHVGPLAEELDKRSDLVAYTVSLEEVDRAICDGKTDGFARIHADRRGRIVGCTVVSSHAGDLINEISVAMTHGVTLGGLANTIHAYPTQSEVLWKAAGAYNRSRMTPTIKGWLQRWFRWRLG